MAEASKGNAVSLEKGKLSPQAVEIEMSVLSVLFQFPDALDELAGMLHHKMFYKKEHVLIYSAIERLQKRNESVDLLTVNNELISMGEIKNAGDMHYLIGLSVKASSSAHVEFHARIIVQKYIARQIISISNSAIEKSYSSEIDVLKLLDMTTKQFDDLDDEITSGYSSQDWAEACLSIPERVEFLSNNQGKITGVTTGLKATDKHFSGWQPEDMIVIGADSGMGKTAFVMNNMIAVAQNNDAVGMFSMEMSVVQLAIRATATQSNYHMNQLMRTGFDKQKYFKGGYHR